MVHHLHRLADVRSCLHFERSAAEPQGLKLQAYSASRSGVVGVPLLVV